MALILCSIVVARRIRVEYVRCFRSVLQLAAYFFWGFGTIAVDRDDHGFCLRVQKNDGAFQPFLLFIGDVLFAEEPKKTTGVMVFRPMLYDIFNI